MSISRVKYLVDLESLKTKATVPSKRRQTLNHLRSVTS